MPAAPPAADSKKPATPPPAKDKKPDDKAAGGASRPAQAQQGSGRVGKGAATNQTAKPQTQAAEAQAGQGDKAAASQQRFDRMAIRAKLAVSDPGDAVEREADAVAERISRKFDRSTAHHGGPVDTSARGQRPVRAAPQQGAGTPTPDKTDAPTVARAAETGDVRPPEEPPREPRAEEAGAEQTPARDDPRTRIRELRGKGEPLDEDVRARMGREYGHDFSHVRIHTDTQSDALCRSLHALAFTTGNDIFFARGRYQPHSKAGIALLAHELAHVVQQQDSGPVVARKIDPDMEAQYKPKNEAMTASALKALSKLDIPAVKARHLTSPYQTLASNGQLKRKRGYDRGNPAQVGVWMRQDPIPEARIRQRLTERGLKNVPADASEPFPLILGDKPSAQSRSIQSLQSLLKIPTWSRYGKPVGKGFQVDHIVELQVSGENGEGTGNSIENMELLDQPSNSSSGGAIRAGIYKKVDAYLQTFTDPIPKRTIFLKNHDLVFETVSASLGMGSSAGASSWWSLAEIQAAKPLETVKAAPPSDAEGNDKEFLLADAPKGVVIQSFTHAAGPGTFDITGTAQTAIAGLKLSSVTVNTQAATGSGSGSVGTLAGTWNLPAKWTPAAGDVTVALTGDGKYRGYPSKIGKTALNFEHLSPVSFGNVVIEGGGLSAGGPLTPSLPLLKASIPIQVSLRGDDLRFSLDYSAGQLDLGAPGVTIEDALVSVFYSTSEGFGVGGGFDFALSQVDGSMQASYSEGKGIEVAGQIDFSSELFDAAKVSAWWSQNEGFGASGELAITKPNKIKGLKSAKLTATYADRAFTAKGDAETDIPGIKRFTAEVKFIDADNFTVSGTGEFEQLPGIESGSLTLTLDHKSGAWSLSGSGNAVPKLPGGAKAAIAAQYDKGLVVVTGDVTLTYGVDLLTGGVKATVTNAANVSKDGVPSGDPTDAFKVFGTGSVSAKLGPITGKVDVELQPAGDVLIGGKLTLADQKLFEEYPPPKDKGAGPKLHPIASVPIPGLGFGVGGINVGVVLGVKWGYDAYASIGPGWARDIHVTIAKFNPKEFKPSDIKLEDAGARLEIPATAGVSLSAAIELTLEAAAVRGGARLTATAAAEIPKQPPAITGAVKFKWSYDDGLDFTAGIKVKPTAQLKFSLEGTGFAELNLLVDTVTLWSRTWPLGEVAYQLPLNFDVGAEMGWSSRSGFRTQPADLFKPPPVNLGTDDFTRIVDGRPSTQQIVNIDEKTGRVVNDEDLVCREPMFSPEPDACSMDDANACVSPAREHEADAVKAPDAVDEGIVDQLGRGMPLDLATRGFFEQRLKTDLSRVRIHTGPPAVREAERLVARAFTVGEHIAFAEGEYQPDSEAGRALLAHELAHVVQQQGGSREALMRITTDPTATAASGNCFSVDHGSYAGTRLCTDAGNRCLSLPLLRLPALKQRNASLFPLPLPVRQGARPRTDQTSNWRAAVQASAQTQVDTLATVARSAGAVETSGGRDTYFLTFRGEPNFLLFGTADTLRPRIEIPIWDGHGRATNFQVDHIREMQLDGEDVDTNYELLEGDANMGAGRAIAEQIRDTIQGGLAALHTANPSATALPAATSWRRFKNSYRVSYAAIRWNLPHDGSGNGWRKWSLQEVRDSDQVAQLRPLDAAERARIGRGSSPVIFPSVAGGEALPAVSRPRRDWIPCVDLVAWTPADATTGGDLMGTLTVDVLKARSGAARATGVAVPLDYPSQSWSVKRVPGLNAGYVDPASVNMGVRNSLRLPGMSPIEMGEVSLSRAGLAGEGRVLPTVPLIADADIRVRISGVEAQVYKTFAIDDIRLPAPFHMDGCDLTVFFSSARGLGLEGRADFSVDRLGSGYLGAAASTGSGFALAGGFDFDPQLFDRANVEMAYRDGQLSLAGDIGIDTPDKIRGIRAANLHMEYAAGSFAATGSVDPDLPGVRQAGLRVSYGEEVGLVIGGNLELEANAAIRSGSVDVTLSKPDDRWRVAATGSAQPAIPGVDSTLTVSYDDGAFDASLHGAFARGMLAGRVEVGATNRAVDDSVQPTGPAEPGAPIVVYGGGSATIRVAPWLQGTAGIRFAPDGECTLFGEIGLPDTLEIFPRREIRRQLFALSTQIPIVPGVVAEVGGNLSASAGVGPGVLDQARVGIEYNPEHEENTHVTGDAHLNVPADAGLRLGARAGVGLGITGANATGGLELGGTLGIAGAAEAGVQVDWMPLRGLAIDAEAGLRAAPRFRFDISGYVDVSVLGASLYDQRWELAAYEVGSNFEFGVRFPIRYREGEPFNVSTDDIVFEVPEIDPESLLGQVGTAIF